MFISSNKFTLAVVLIVFLPIIGCNTAPAPQAAAPPAPVEKAATPPPEPPKCTDCVPVTVDNFNRAETDRTFYGVGKLQEGFSKFRLFRVPTPLNEQAVPRANRDTLYSVAVFDLDAAPVTITLPDAGKRYETLMVIDEDHYVHGVFYGAGKHVLSKDQIGTRYVLAAVRIFVDPNSPQDLYEVHKLQDAIKVDQKSLGTLEFPKWDGASQGKLRDALIVLGSTMPDYKHAFGAKNDVDPVRHIIGTATAWGGNPDKDAVYLNVFPPKNDGKTIYRLNVKDVPVDGFWSTTVYNAKGYLEENKLNAYSLNNVTAKKDTDGGITIQFGGCDANTPNCLPTTPGWNYVVRLYRPRPEVISGKYKFPEAQPVP
jgi:hypothetical protein